MGHTRTYPSALGSKRNFFSIANVLKPSVFCGNIPFEGLSSDKFPDRLRFREVKDLGSWFGGSSCAEPSLLAAIAAARISDVGLLFRS